MNPRLCSRYKSAPAIAGPDSLELTARELTAQTLNFKLVTLNPSRLHLPIPILPLGLLDGAGMVEQLFVGRQKVGTN